MRDTDWAWPLYCAKCGKPLMYVDYDEGRYDVLTGEREYRPTGRCPMSDLERPHGDLSGDYHTWHSLRQNTVAREAQP